MVKKFFSVVLLLTVCAVAQASQTAPAATATPAVKAPCAAPACKESKGMMSSVCSSVSSCAASAKNLVVAHPVVSAVVAAAACCAVALQFDAVRNVCGMSCNDSEKCPCTKRDACAPTCRN